MGGAKRRWEEGWKCNRRLRRLLLVHCFKTVILAVLTRIDTLGRVKEKQVKGRGIVVRRQGNPGRGQGRGGC